jgi:hypothetical protein
MGGFSKCKEWGTKYLPNFSNNFARPVEREFENGSGNEDLSY